MNERPLVFTSTFFDLKILNEVVKIIETKDYVVNPIYLKNYKKKSFIFLIISHIGLILSILNKNVIVTLLFSVCCCTCWYFFLTGGKYIHFSSSDFLGRAIKEKN